MSRNRKKKMRIRVSYPTSGVLIDWNADTSPRSPISRALRLSHTFSSSLCHSPSVLFVRYRCLSLSLSPNRRTGRSKTRARDNTMLATVNFGRASQIPPTCLYDPIDADLSQFRTQGPIKKHSERE